MTGDIRKGALAALLFIVIFKSAQSKSDPGIVEVIVSSKYPSVQQQRPLLADTAIYVKISVNCSSNDPHNLTISWKLKERPCLYDDRFLDLPNASILAHNRVQQAFQISASCDKTFVLLDNKSAARNISAAQKFQEVRLPKRKKYKFGPSPKPVSTVDADGVYELELTIEPDDSKTIFRAAVQIEFIGPHGYISAIDAPFLWFYLIMCLAYVVFGIIWLAVSFMQWRDLLRIQFWIGGVILLGMLEKAFFYVEYETISDTGLPVPHAELVAEIVSCAKRTLARMLVIIVSLGFGIVKPRLGPMLHRVVGIGTLYFLLASIEGYLRVTNAKNERSELLVASIPLALLDTGICWWIFTSLVQTMRTLRLRRNTVKLSLYRHFTNTLYFAVITSILFMIAALRLRNLENCTPGWHTIWMDTAFWHVLFSVLLLVIMILWRPTNNNQRYAFTPLLDNPEDEDEEDEEDQFVADSYGIKMRSNHLNGNNKTPPSSLHATTTEEDDLRWVEEHIPSALVDNSMPVLDSDEEIVNTKFEVSKMQ